MGGSHQSRHRGVAARRDTAESARHVRRVFGAGVGIAYPFAATYGNHDFQCGILADEQDDLYREFAGCMNPVAGSSPLALEPGTFALPIEASDGSGRITMSVMMVNSGDYADTADAGDGNGRSRSPNTRNTRRIRAAGIWLIPTATAPPRRKPSNG